MTGKSKGRPSGQTSRTKGKEGCQKGVDSLMWIINRAKNLRMNDKKLSQRDAIKKASQQFHLVNPKHSKHAKKILKKQKKKSTK